MTVGSGGIGGYVGGGAGAVGFNGTATSVFGMTCNGGGGGGAYNAPTRNGQNGGCGGGGGTVSSSPGAVVKLICLQVLVEQMD